MRYNIYTIITALCLGCSQTGIVPSVYEVYYPQGQTSSHKQVNRLKITAAGPQTLIEVTSQSGIGSGL